MDKMGKIRKDFFSGSITERAIILLEMHGRINQYMLEEMLDIRWDTAEKIIAHLQAVGLIDENLDEIPRQEEESEDEGYEEFADDEIYEYKD